jgi:hypothetical protein
MNNAVSRLFFLVVAILGPMSSTAQEEEDIEFNIMRNNGDLVVWVNLADLISGSQVDKISDGIDLVIEYEFNLAAPRRFLGETSVATRTFALRISFRPITESFHLTSLEPRLDSGRVFQSYSLLRRHLADSIAVAVVALDSLDSHRQYRLEIKVSLISMTEFSRVQSIADSSGSESPLKYLFKQFLALTAFGRVEFRTKSRSFSLSEVTFEP